MRWLPKRVLFGHMDGSGQRGNSHKQWVDSCQRRLANCRTFIHMVEKIPRQGRLEGCHRTSAATHLIYGLESM